MKKEEFIQQIQAIGKCEDDAQRRTMLSELETGVTADYDQIETLTKQNNDLTERNRTLTDYNMQLFLKVGQKTEPDTKKDTGHENLKYDDLFDENGGLK